MIIFAIPMLIGNVFQQMYNLVDSVIVGKYVGANALEAVGATNHVSFLFFSLCNGIGSGGGIITAQQFGTGHEENTKKSIVNAGYILMTGSLIMGAIAFFAAKGVLGLMATPEEIMADAVLYMQMQCVGLDLWFVCGFKMGVFGAALATIIAQFVAGVGCLLYAVKCNPYFRFDNLFFCDASGDAAFALINGVVEVVVRITLPILMTSMVAFGVLGIWWAAGLTWMISAFFCWLRYVSWKKKLKIT